MSIVYCKVDPIHQYSDHLKTCPYCKLIENSSQSIHVASANQNVSVANPQKVSFTRLIISISLYTCSFWVFFVQIFKTFEVFFYNFASYNFNALFERSVALFLGLTILFIGRICFQKFFDIWYLLLPIIMIICSLFAVVVRTIFSGHVETNEIAYSPINFQYSSDHSFLNFFAVLFNETWNFCTFPFSTISTSDDTFGILNNYLSPSVLIWVIGIFLTSLNVIIRDID